MKSSKIATALAKIPPMPQGSKDVGMGSRPTLKKSVLYNKIAELKKDPINK